MIFKIGNLFIFSIVAFPFALRLYVKPRSLLPKAFSNSSEKASLHLAQIHLYPLLPYR